MIIPIKCFTCGQVLADKYEYYLREVRKIKLEKNINLSEIHYLDQHSVKLAPEGEVLDNLGLKKMCCRRHLLTHVDIK